MDWKLFLQIAGAVLGLLYLWLEYKADVWLWVVGIIMPCVHSVLYFKSGLYADFGMQLYYVAAGIWGLAAWLLAQRRDRLAAVCGSGTSGADPGAASGAASGAAESLPIRRTPLRTALLLVPVYAALHAALYFILVRYTDSTVPFWDAMTTALGMVAMWMLSKKYTGQWLVWLAVDAITTGLYVYKGIPVTAGLYSLYCVLAVVGYRKWLDVAKCDYNEKSAGISTDQL